MLLNLSSAEAFVRKSPGYFWDGWTIKQFVPNDKAMFRTNGAFKDGRWGFMNTYEVNEKGKYNVRVDTRANGPRSHQSRVATSQPMR